MYADTLTIFAMLLLLVWSLVSWKMATILYKGATTKMSFLSFWYALNNESIFPHSTGIESGQLNQHLLRRYKLLFRVVLLVFFLLCIYGLIFGGNPSQGSNA